MPDTDKSCWSENQNVAMDLKLIVWILNGITWIWINKMESGKKEFRPTQPSGPAFPSKHLDLLPWCFDFRSQSFGVGFQPGPTYHYNDVIMGAMASQITSLTIVYSTVYSDADHRKHQSSASLAFVVGIHWWPVNSTHKWPITRKMFPFDDAIMY